MREYTEQELVRRQKARKLREKNIDPFGHRFDVTSNSKEIKDLANVPEATLGKSQISSDSIESDMKFLEKNPKLAMAINQAIDNYAETHTEDETMKMLEKCHQEFVAKK